MGVFVEMCHKILKKVIKCSKIFAIFKVPFQKFTQYLFLAKSNIMDGVSNTHKHRDILPKYHKISQ